MGKSEDLLKEVILDKYKSIREFTQEIGMPYSTVDTILKRGIRKSNVDNLIRICADLEISADALVQGYIEKLKPITTIAAHHDEEEWTEEELEEIEAFKQFVISKRNNGNNTLMPEKPVESVKKHKSEKKSIKEFADA